jgi:hypothetical protein
MAEHLESLARAIHAERRRLCFYDVNAHRSSRDAEVGTRRR